MTADGNWNLVVSTPMGERRATLSATTDGSTLKGSRIADGNSVEIFDGMVNGNELSWKVSITEPMPMTLEFNGTVNGDELSGSVILAHAALGKEVVHRQGVHLRPGATAMAISKFTDNPGFAVDEPNAGPCRTLTLPRRGTDEIAARKRPANN